jgi:hypothetical protein
VLLTQEVVVLPLTKLLILPLVVQVAVEMVATTFLLERLQEPLVLQIQVVEQAVNTILPILVVLV